MNGAATGGPNETVRALAVVALIGGAAAVGYLLSNDREPQPGGTRTRVPAPASPRTKAPSAPREGEDRLTRIEADLATLRERQAAYERQLQDLIEKVAEFERTAQPLPPELRARIEEIVAGGPSDGQVRVMRDVGNSMIRSQSEGFIRGAALDEYQAGRFRAVIDDLVEKRNEMIRRFSAGEADYPAMIQEGSSMLTGALVEAHTYLTEEQYAYLRATVEDMPPVRMGIIRIGEEAPAVQVPPPPTSGR